MNAYELARKRRRGQRNDGMKTKVQSAIATPSTIQAVRSRAHKVAQMHTDRPPARSDLEETPANQSLLEQAVLSISNPHRVSA